MRLVFSIVCIFCSTSLWALTNSVIAEDNSWGAVVFIRHEGVDDTGDSVPAYCNGTFISDHQIVTAAHCVSQAEALGKTQSTFQIGHYKYVNNPAGQPVRVGYKVLHEETQKAVFRFLPSVVQKIRKSGVRAQIGADEDVAVIILPQKVDLARFNYKPVSVVSVAEWAGLQNRVLSYMPSLVTINPFADITTNDTKRMAQLNHLKVSGKSLESKSSSRVEMSDSGGPLFVRIGSEWKLLAVTKGLAKSFFGSWDSLTIVPGNLP